MAAAMRTPTISTSWPRRSRGMSDPLASSMGLRSGDGIEGGGREGQIIYGGAGNDTINGTGRMTITSNDTIKGDGGMTRSTEDLEAIQSTAIMGTTPSSVDLVRTFSQAATETTVFVYLSVANSNAAQFDTITDFESGSDRIDLTALAHLTFLSWR